KVGTLAKWSLAYVIVNQIGIWVVKALANGVQGGVAAYDNSFLIYSLPYGIVAVSVFTALVPSLAEHHVKADYAAFREDFSLGLRMTSFVILPASAGLVALSQPVIRLLLEHGTFSSESTRLFADTFAFMTIGLAAYAAFQQMNRAFYSMQDARTPWFAKSIGVAVNVATAVPLFLILGVPGLGLSHTFSYLTALTVAAMILRTRAGGLGGRELVTWHLKVAGASVATGLTAWGVASLVGAQVQLETLGGQIAQVGSAILAGIVVYLAITAAARLPELGRLISTARRVI
ncbi:MAG: murein biosynthesis integral membrane protein MurJ, partial [Actinomycetota bacterium]